MSLKGWDFSANNQVYKCTGCVGLTCTTDKYRVSVIHDNATW